MKHSISQRPGFTLIEVLMATVLGGLILTAAAGFVFGVFQLNIVAEKEPQFEEHVNSATRFLEYAFSSAIPPEGNQSNQTGNQNQQSNQDDSSSSGEGAVSWKEIPGNVGLDDEVLSFKLDGNLPIFVDEEMAFMPQIDCWLVFEENEGLLLKWRTEEMAREDDDNLNTNLISPYVNEMIYWYYDAEDDRWEDSDEVETADEGGNKFPDFIALKFKSPDGREASRQLLLPPEDATELLP